MENKEFNLGEYLTGSAERIVKGAVRAVGAECTDGKTQRRVRPV